MGKREHVTFPIFCRKRVCFVEHFSLESCCALNLPSMRSVYIYIYTRCVIYIYISLHACKYFVHMFAIATYFLITRFSLWRNDSLGLAWSPVAGCVEVRSANST